MVAVEQACSKRNFIFRAHSTRSKRLLPGVAINADELSIMPVNRLCQRNGSKTAQQGWTRTKGMPLLLSEFHWRACLRAYQGSFEHLQSVPRNHSHVQNDYQTWYSCGISPEKPRVTPRSRYVRRFRTNWHIGHVTDS